MMSKTALDAPLRLVTYELSKLGASTKLIFQDTPHTVFPSFNPYYCLHVAELLPCLWNA